MISQQYQEQIEQDIPVLWNGLRLYPFRVKELRQFYNTKSCLETAQQTFPVQYMCMKYLEALYAMHYDSKMQPSESKEPSLFARLVAFLKIALRLPVMYTSENNPIIPLRTVYDSDSPRKLLAIRVEQEGTTVDITPKNFIELREILAAQNHITLSSELDNQELVDAERVLAAKASLDLEFDIENLIFSVSYATGVRHTEIREWTIREFELMEKAIERAKGHMIAALVEANGGKYKNGNPFPSWKFDKKYKTQALIALSELKQNLSGSVEMQ